MLTSTNFSILDSMGSYDVDTHHYMGYEPNDNTFYPYESYYYYKVRINDFGLWTHISLGDNIYGETVYDSEVIYYDDPLLPLLPLLPYKFINEGEERVFSDFFKVTSSVDDIQEDDSQAQYFTTQGIRVKEDRLTPGLYIKVKNNKSEKIFIR